MPIEPSYDQVCSWENLRLAYDKAARGKRVGPALCMLTADDSPRSREPDPRRCHGQHKTPQNGQDRIPHFGHALAPAAIGRWS